MAQVPLQLARMAGAPGRPVRPARPGTGSTDPAPHPGAPQPVSPRLDPLPRPGLLELARTSMRDLVRWAQVRRALRLHRRRPA